MKDTTPASDPSMKPGSHHPFVLVLGLGNPILGDDGIGWKVAEQVQLELGSDYPEIEIDYASLGGLSLMERMLGYHHVILVDAMETGADAPGTVTAFPLGALPDSMAGHTSSAHDTSLSVALAAASNMGADTPARVDVVAIEIASSLEFSEMLSQIAAAAVPIATRKVLEIVNERQAT